MSLKKWVWNVGKKVFYHLPFALQAYISKIVWKPQFQGGNIFGYGTKTYYGKCVFGYGTRIAGSSIYTNISVGNYTVFAEGFRVLGFLHDYSAFSIHSGIKAIIPDIQVSTQDLHEPGIVDYDQTVIGSDVWIGENVTVKGGIHIGDGAVIAARSVVTHDVPPFAIVGGGPARFIKWRFDDEKIELLKSIHWWDWPPEKIRDNYEKLCNFDSTLKDENGSEEV